jgi:hypothetical protein
MTLAAFQRARRKVKARIEPFQCILGDASDNPYAPEDGYYWVRRFDRADNNGLTTPGNPFRVRSGTALVVPRGGRRVWVGNGLDGHLTVLGFVHDDLTAPGVNIDPRGAQPNDPYRAWIRLKQIQNFRALPLATGNTASLKVQVRQIFYYTPEGDIVRYNGTNESTHIDLAAYVPAANLQRYAVLWLRTYNPNALSDIQVTVSTPIDSLDLALSFDELQECADLADADTIPIQAFRLHDAQTSLTMDDTIDVDLRPFFNMPQVYGFPNTVTRQYRVHAGHSVIMPSAVSVSAGGAVQIQDNAVLVVLDAVEPEGGGITASDVFMPVVGTPVNTDLQDDFTARGSSGVIDGTIVYVTADVGAGTHHVQVAAGEGYLRTTNDQQGDLKIIEWSAASGIEIATPAAGFETARFIGVEYNSGTPQVTTRTTFNWNWYTDFPLARVSYDGTTLRILNVYAHAEDTANKVRRMLRLTMPFQREEAPEGTGGLEISEVATRQLAMSAGHVWHGLNEIVVTLVAAGTAFDTHYRKLGGGFNSTTGVTQYPNLQYDDGSGTLVTMTNNRYACLWVYVDVADSSLDVMYGRDQYTSAALAQAEAVPTTPDHLTYHGRLIARIIFQKSASSATLIESAWGDGFSAGASVSAPTDATYLLQVTNASLPNAQAMGALATGDMQVTTTTGVVTSLKANRVAVTNPTVTSDAAAGYSVGSRWINIALGLEYVCVDTTNGAAVWRNVTNISTGWQDDGTVVRLVTTSDNVNIGGTAASTYTLRIENNDDTSGLLELRTNASMAVPPLNITDSGGSPLSYLDIDNWKLPEQTTAERDALTTVAGRIVYNTTTDQPEYCDDDRWLALRPLTNGHSGLTLRKRTAAIIDISTGMAEVAGALARKNTVTTLTMSTAGDWIGGSVLESASEFVWVYIDSASNLKLYDIAPNYPLANTASRVANMRVNQAGWNGTAGSGLNATTVTYDTDTGEGSVLAGMYALIYSDSAYTTGRGRGSAAAASLNDVSAALITVIDTGANTLTLEAGHNIAINDNDYIIVVQPGALLYRDVSSTWWRAVGRIYNNSGSDLDNTKMMSLAYVDYTQGTDPTTTSTSLTDLDATNLSLQVFVQGDSLETKFFGTVSNSTANAAVSVGVSVDGVDYAPNEGISQIQSGANERSFAGFAHIIPHLLPGTHTLNVRWKVISNTGRLWCGENANAQLVPQFSVREVKNG